MKQTLSILFILMLSQIAMSQNTILWKVTDTTSNKTSYIVGTYHQFGNSFVDSIPKVKEFLLASDVAVFESLDKVEDIRKMIQNRKSSLEIEKHLKKKELKQLKEITKNWKVDLYKLKPLEIRWKLAQDYQKIICETVKPKDEFDEFDSYLMHLAKENNIKLVGLETNQIELIEKEYNAPNWKEERKNIRIWIKKIKTDKPSSSSCIDANRYRKFDLDYDFTESCQLEILIKQRHKDWMKVLPKLLQNNNAFVAVGWYHLRWKCGLIEQLKNEGFILEPVTM